jgi:methyl-accepting chemotaxis protein
VTELGATGTRISAQLLSTIDTTLQAAMEAGRAAATVERLVEVARDVGTVIKFIAEIAVEDAKVIVESVGYTKDAVGDAEDRAA